MEQLNSKAEVSPVPTPPPPPIPSLGRIVHYIPESETDVTASNHAEVVPALVVRVWDGLLVNLQVVIDGEKGTAWKTSVPYNADKKPGTWHWPEIKK